MARYSATSGATASLAIGALCAAVLASFIAQPAAGAVLTTGSGDGAVTIFDLSEYGAFSSANYDPVGDIPEAGTTYESSIYVRRGAERYLLEGLVDRPATITTATDTEYVSNFGVGALDITLTQTLTNAFQDNSPVGAALTQQFTIRNTGVLASFDIVRYLDGDLTFDGTISDSGGVTRVGATRILFETDGADGIDENGSDGEGPIETGDARSTAAPIDDRVLADDTVPGAATTFLGITSTTRGVIEEVPPQRFEINAYSGLRDAIQSGFDLENRIEGDDNGDDFIDTPYDVTLALQDFITVREGQTVVYTTQTLFGNAVPPVPGETEAAPLLPDDLGPEGGFVFNIPANQITEGQTIFIDPLIATGYTYVVTGAAFMSVTAPSFGAVPDGDMSYVLTANGADTTILSGQEIFFAAFASGPVTSFTLTEIDPSLSLNPANPLAFVTGVSLMGISGTMVQITQTPIASDVSAIPLPASGALLVLSLLGLARMRKRANG